ncbi:VirB4 family type IV secretion/conjugal transfer ATPase [Wolbachia endosymbiont of Pentidionis agamae]|uniref:VirB4 family type IV secretion/conjugal transfer ATPase n=1 Tax=Wolbachia endosymbiont of Pentidionis agamae TaxID=3110435 RepID=UPI002FD5FB61
MVQGSSNNNSELKKKNFSPIENVNLDFIPYACHYDEETILTKNGELLQIIKIDNCNLFSSDSNLRNEIRKSITKNINDTFFSIWIHTVRKRSNFELGWKDTNDFSDQLHSTWLNKLSNGKLYYENGLYIVILVNNLHEVVKNPLLFNSIKSKYKALLEKNHQKLQKTVGSIKKDLESFKAEKLGIKFDQNNPYSEVLELLYHITTLTNKRYFLAENNASSYVKDLKIAFGFNSFQITFQNRKKYGSIFRIKEYKEIPLSTTSHCLNLDGEFIITEIILTSTKNKAMKIVNKQAAILQISEDKNFLQMSGIDEMIEYQNTGGVKFCEQAIMFTIHADDKSRLAKNTQDLSSVFASIGLMLVKTDLHLEDHFWSQLPGNFSFIIQPKAILMKYACSFSLLHHSTLGTLKGGKWNQAITAFTSNKGDLYFFNFHNKKNSGHTAILGVPNSGKTSLINFLLSESRKCSAKIVILDSTGKSIIFTKAIGGKYYILDSKYKDKSLKFNPLNVEDSVENRNMLCELIRRMIGGICSEETNNKIKKVVNSIFILPEESRSISKLSEVLNLLGGNISKWLDDGELTYLLKESNESDDIDWNAEVITINTSHLIKQAECISVILYYFLYSFEVRCNGSPTILVLHEASKVISIFRTEKEFNEWMLRMTKLNVVVIFSIENLMSEGQFTQYLEKHIDTEIFMPNVNASRLYMKYLSLSRKELNILLQTPEQEGLFLIKQYEDLVTLNLDIKNMKEAYVLSANKETVKYMYDAIKEKGERANEWLPVFYEKCEV